MSTHQQSSSSPVVPHKSCSEVHKALLAEVQGVRRAVDACLQRVLLLGALVGKDLQAAEESARYVDRVEAVLLRAGERGMRTRELRRVADLADLTSRDVNGALEALIRKGAVCREGPKGRGVYRVATGEAQDHGPQE